MKRLTAIALTVMLSTGMSGCYSSFQIPTTELRKLQSPEGLMNDRILGDNLQKEEMLALVNRQAKDSIAVTTGKNTQVAVTTNTRVYVRSSGGRRYRITPFNFRIAGSQLVASDRDTLLPMANISASEVDLLSAGKTTGMIGLGVVTVAGVIAVIVANAGKKTFDE